MGKKTSKSDLLTVLLVSLACVSCAGVGLYFLYVDIVSVDDRGRGEPMATIERRELKVRRKPSGSFIWSYVEKNQFLYKKDSLQTGSGSTASIRLKDQSTLELGEESLVVIDDIKNLSLNFIRGSMVVRSEKGDRQISVAKDGKLKIEELPLRLLTPTPQESYFSTEGIKKEILFSWERKKEISSQNKLVLSEEPLLQVSTDRYFSDSRTQNIKVSNPGKQNARLPLLSGKYYWRFLLNDKVITEVRVFKIINTFVLRPLWPLTTTEKIKIWQDGGTLPFRWKNENTFESQGSSGEHRLEISKEADFKKILRSETVASQSGQAQILISHEGSFYWRIKSRFGDQNLTSQPEKFTIEKNQKLSIELQFPSSGSSVEVRKDFRFIWKAPFVPGIDYQFELEATPSSAGKEKKQRWTERSTLTSFSWKQSRPGHYRWRVIAFQQKEIAGETNWQGLTLFQGKPTQLLYPKNLQGIYYWEKPIEFNFAWEKDLALSTNSFYHLEIATDVEFKTKVSSEKLTTSFATSAQMKLKPGLYFWRVGVQDENGEMIKVSEVNQFMFGPFPLLEPPAQALPAPGTQFDVVREPLDPILSWDQVKDATSYEVTVIQGGDLKKTLILKKITERPSFQLPTLKEGQYLWSVRPIDPLKRLGLPLAQRNFEISYGKPLGAPQILSQEVQ